MDDWMFTSKGIYDHLTNCEALVKLIGNVLDDKDIDDAEAGARIRVLYHGYKIAEEVDEHGVTSDQPRHHDVHPSEP